MAIPSAPSLSDLRPDRSGPPPVRVMVVCDHLGYEGHLHGSGRFMLEMAAGYDRERIQGPFLVLQSGGRLEDSVQRDGIPVRFLGYHRFDIRQVARLVQLIRQTRPHVLHLWDFGAATYGRIAARITGTPAVVHIHSEHSANQRRGFPPYVRLMYRALARDTALAVAVSDSTAVFAQREMGFRPDQLRVVHNPVSPRMFAAPDPGAVLDLRRQYRIPASAPVVGVLTRFFPVKGNDVVIEAFARVAERFPEAHLVMAGEGPLRGALEAQAHAAGLGERVIFPGPVRDVLNHLGLFTLSAMGSFEEGFSIAASESITAGVPLVGTRIGGLRQVVQDGGTGVLIPPGDPAAMADAMARLLGDRGLVERMRAACLADRERFSFERYARAMEICYREAAGLRGRAAPDVSALMLLVHSVCGAGLA